jgi:ubiquinone/menaquinone biosynthesis C-methylase UbiE
MGTGTLDEYREAVYEVAEALAPTWERRRGDIESVAAPMRDWMVRELRSSEGDTVLELAAGIGDTGFEAAAIVGESGRLITTDVSPAMLDAARRRGAELGVTNVDYRVMDAEHIELDDQSVDGVLCRFGYMLLADPAAALAETRRVLRTGGRLALAVWGTPERNPFFAAIGISLVQRGHVPPPEPPPAPGPFSMASPERTEGLLRDAGFGDVRTEEVPSQFVVADVDAYLSLIADTSGPIALVLRGLAEPDRAAVRSDVEDSLRPFAANGRYEVPCVALCAVAS